MNTGTYVAISVGVASTIAAVYVIRRYKRKPQKIEEKNLINKSYLKRKIDDYFESFKIDRKDYELYSFYSIQFDLKGYDKEYKKKVKYIGTLYDL